jgi:hypothetical protein
MQKLDILFAGALACVLTVPISAAENESPVPPKTVSAYQRKNGRVPHLFGGEWLRQLLHDSMGATWCGDNRPEAPGSVSNADVH